MLGTDTIILTRREFRCIDCCYLVKQEEDGIAEWYCDHHNNYCDNIEFCKFVDGKVEV